MDMKKYVTDINNKIYFEEQEVNDVKDIDEEIKVYKSKQISFFSGMGGALTPSSTINYTLLDIYNKHRLIQAYFKDLKYKYIRLPIGSCDFSKEKYDYYKPFGINMEKDNIYISPLLDDIRDEYDLNYLAAPWSPPAIWKWPLINRLRRLCYGRYARYLIKYLKYYKEQGINIDFLSIQNEPRAYQKWESCVWSYKAQKTFIEKYMIPQLNKNNLSTTIMLYDHNKDDMLKQIDKLYIDNNKVSSVGFHWYTGSHFDEVQKVHDKYPNLLLIESEMSCGYSPYKETEWIKDAELYANEIIGNINHGMNIFIDWNLLLDDKGGPNHKDNFVKSPIIRKKKEIVLTPIYHYLKHISYHSEKMVLGTIYNKLKVVTSKDGNNYIITVLNNTNDDISFDIKGMVKDKINKHSIITYYI